MKKWIVHKKKIISKIKIKLYRGMKIENFQNFSFTKFEGQAVAIFFKNYAI